MSRKQKTRLRERFKALRNSKKPEIINGTLTNEEKIKELEGRIKNCRMDLELFPDNEAILNKIRIMNEQIENLRDEIPKKKDDEIDLLDNLIENEIGEEEK